MKTQLNDKAKHTLQRNPQQHNITKKQDNFSQKKDSFHKVNFYKLYVQQSEMGMCPFYKCGANGVNALFHECRNADANGQMDEPQAVRGLQMS